MYVMREAIPPIVPFWVIELLSGGGKCAMFRHAFSNAILWDVNHEFVIEPNPNNTEAWWLLSERDCFQP